MKQAIMKKWVRALRSGKYKQTDGALKDKMGGYCCLGVLCQISKLGDFETGEDGNLKFIDDSATLPEKVQKWSGVKTDIGKFRGKVQTEAGERECLTEINDDGMTFNQIANVIEKKWRSL